MSKDKDKIAEKEILRLLEQYHHFCYMNSGMMKLFKGWGANMNLEGFMHWLNSRKD